MAYTLGPATVNAWPEADRVRNAQSALWVRFRTFRQGLMRAILDVLLLALDLFQWVIIAVAVMSWLIAFDVLNIRQDFVRTIWNALNALTEPLLRPIRRMLPTLGGLDISPVILLLIIYFLQRVIIYYLYPMAISF